MLKTPDHSQSFWVATAPTPASLTFAPLARDLDVDVAVVGGGITGVTAALLLQREGKRVALLEANRVAEGVTANTTAHLTEAIDARYRTLLGQIGVDATRLVAESSRAAIRRIGDFINELSIDCDYKHLPGFLYTEDEDEMAKLHEEFEAARRVGLDVVMTRNVPVPLAKMGIRFANQASLHVRQYVLPLVAAFVQRGGLVFENTRVVDIHDGEPCALQTETGVVRADATVVATNVPMNRVFLQSKIAHYQSYVLALSVQHPELAGLFWDTRDPYHYLRSASAPDGSTVLIVGGEDHRTGIEDDTTERYEKLLRYAQARFSVDRVVARWSAQVVEPVDGLPYIGRNSMSNHTYVATGYSGNGITFGTLAAMMITDEVMGRKNPYHDVFKATRMNVIASAKSFVTENTDTLVHFVADRVQPPDATSVDGVGRGEGKIVDLAGKRLAIYRDNDGTIFAHSAVCTHLGCVVAFNAAERSWDCPCHGSRFRVNGSVICGPATLGLRPCSIEAEHDEDPALPLGATPQPQ